MKSFLALGWCLFLLSATEGQTPASKTPTNGTIQGQIVQQPGGLPIRKAAIVLVPAAEEERGEDEYKTVTDVEGRFKLEDVKPGNYRLYFGCEGFVTSEKRHHDSGMLLSLKPAQEIKDLLFHLTPAALITGRVRDGDGDPVRDADVFAIPYGTVPHGDQRRSRLHNVGQCSTNDLGECRISDLAPGRYLVAAQPRFHGGPLVERGTDKEQEVYTTTYYPGMTEKKLAVPLDLRGSDELPVELVLASVRTFHVRGRVTNLPAWTSKEGAEVILQPQDEENPIDLPRGNLDKYGGFDIKGVVPGSYHVLVFPTRIPRMLGEEKAGDPQAMRTTEMVQVTDRDVNDVRVAALANGQVRGQLRMDNGQKMDWSGGGVTLRADHGMSGGTGQIMVVTDDEYAGIKRDGSFETLALPETYHLQFTLTDKIPIGYFVKAVNLDGKDVADSGLTVGGSKYSLDVVVSSNGATIDGVVTENKDKPVSDITVICIPDAKRRQRRDLYQLVTTDPRGHFSLRGLNPGEYQVLAIDDDVDWDEITDPEFVCTHGSSGQTVRLEEGEHKSIVLKLAVSSD